MYSILEIWYKYKKWCRLVILLFQGGQFACKNILSKLGMKDTTDGAEFYSKLKPYESKIKKLGFFQRKTLLPDNEVIDLKKMDISLSTHVIQLLDTQKNYPQIAELRYQRTELFFMPEKERGMTEQQFSEYWDRISQLLASLNYDIDLVKCLKTAEHLSQEHEKILKDITYKIKVKLEKIHTHRDVKLEKIQTHRDGPLIIETPRMLKDYENWLRLVVLINYAGKKLCDEVLHEKEDIGDGAQLYSKLEKHKDKIHYQIHEEIFCPSNKIIDKSKFDLAIYGAVIHLLFGLKYEDLIYEVRDMRNKIFHMTDESISTANFNKLWSEAGNMLCKHGFDIKSLDDLRTCDISSVEDLKGLDKPIFKDLKDIVGEALDIRRGAAKEILKELKENLERRPVTTEVENHKQKTRYHKKEHIRTASGSSPVSKSRRTEVLQSKELEFKGATRRAKSKFLKVSDKSSIDDIFKLMTDEWNIEKPQILISVTGGAKSFSLQPKLRLMFANGLRKISETPGCWVITGGTNTGVMKQVGEAMEGRSQNLIGIAAWGIVYNRNELDKNKDLINYKVETSMVLEKEACLDHNHGYFVLFDDGSTEKFGREIDFRSRLEQRIMERENVPSVLLVLEGGFGTIQQVLSACQQEIPVVVIKESGRGANVLAYAHENLSDDFLNQNAQEHEGLMSSIKSNFQELKSDDTNPDDENEKNIKKLYNDIISCMRKKGNIKVFQMSDEKDLDEAILLAALPGHSLEKQLQLTLLWNRPDLAENFVLSKSSTWKKKDFQKVTIMALALNRVAFLELLLNYGVSVQSILTENFLQFLYGYVAIIRTNCSPIKYEAADYCDFEEIDLVPELCHLIEHKKSLTSKSFCIKLDVIKKNINKLCNRFIKKGDEICTELLITHGKSNFFEYPYRELFFWALLNHMHEMACFLWRMEEEGIAKALIAAEINGVLALESEQRDLAEELIKQFHSNSQYFKDLAIKILNKGYSTNAKNTKAMITRHLTQFPNHSCLSLAHCSGQQEFISQSCVQQILNDVWMGVIKRKDLSIFSLLLIVFFPPLITRLEFRNKLELEKTVHVEDKKEDVELPKEEAALLKEEADSPRDQLDEKEKPELHWFMKMMQFYLKVPAVKFIISTIAYFIFVIMFAYVTMQGEKNAKPGMAEMVLTLFVVSLTFEEINQICYSSAVGWAEKLDEYLSKAWNIMNIAAIVLFFLALGLQSNASTEEYSHEVYAIDCCIWILRLLSVFYANRILGPYVVMIRSMLKNMFYITCILIVIIMAYGVVTSNLLRTRKLSVSTLSDNIFQDSFSVFRDFFNDDSDKNTASSEVPKKIIYAHPLYLIFCAVFLLVAKNLLSNLQSAIFGKNFSAVQENSDQIWKYERYNLVFEYHKHLGVVPPIPLISQIWLLALYVYNKYTNKENKPLKKLGMSLSPAEMEEVIQFETDCITNILRDKAPDNRKE